MINIDEERILTWQLFSRRSDAVPCGLTMEEELATAKRSHNAHKGIFNQRIKAFESRVASFRRSPEVPQNWAEVEYAFGNVKLSYDKLQNAYTEVIIMEHDPGLEAQNQTYWTSMEECNQEFLRAAEAKDKDKVLEAGDRDDMKRQLEDLQRKLEEQTLGRAEGGAPPKRIAKSEISLKPELLASSMKPVEFRSWKKKFEDWYGTSNFDVATVENQIAYLRSVMDSDLIDKVDFGGATTIRMALDRVEREFMKTHPLLNRRVAFLTMKQPEGQQMSEFLVTFKQSGKEADVDTMTIEELKATLIIGSCSNKELRTKLLEMRPATANKPTVPELEQVVAAFEARKASEDLLNNGSRSRRADSSQGKCHRCQQKGHFVKDCTVPKWQLECKVCGTKGHHNTKPSCKMGKEEEKEVQPKRPKKKKKVKSRRSVTPGPNGTGSATDTEGEESSTEATEDTRRVVATVRAATRKVSATCRQGVTSHPTPPIDIHVKTKASQRGFMKVMDAIPDTGCTSTIIHRRVASRLKLKIDKDVQVSLADAAGKSMETDGMATMYVRGINGASKRIEAIVSPELADPCLLSWKDLITLEYLPEGWPYIKPKVRRTTVTEEEEPGMETKEKPWPPPEWGQEVVDVVNEFIHLFKDKLEEDSRIKCPPMDIEFKEGAGKDLPQATHCRSIPLHLRGMADELVKDTLGAGCIERAIDGDCSVPAHFVPKLNSAGEIVGVRLVADLTGLNKAVKRPSQYFPTGNQIWQNVDPNSKRFFKMDLTSGYHQIPLSKEARKYFNFVLPQGRFRYTSAPMGFVASGDWFNQVTDRCFRGIQGIQKEVDDILGQAVDNSTLAAQLREVLKICQEYNICLSKKKMEVGDDVHFAGFMVGVPGCRPDPAKILALKSVKSPSNPTEVRSFLGAVNQMSCWWPDLSQHCTRLRQLTQANTAWNWLEEHEKDFQKIKELLTDTANLAPFDTKRRTELLTDASKLGIGYVLVQFDEVSRRWRLIKAGSTALKGAQKRYPPIQLELLGLAWALQACDFYLRAHPGFLVKSDHNPLVGIFKKDIRDTSERLQPLLEACGMYNFQVEYIPGKKNLVADLLSRNPLWSEEEGPQVVDRCGRVFTFDDQHKRIREDPRMTEILEAAASSTSYGEAVKAKLEGLSAEEVKQLPLGHGARDYQRWWNTMGVLDDKEDTILVMDGHRIVVPLDARKSILTLLHVPHMATSRTRKAAYKRYFWVGMADEVRKMCESCQSCRERGPSRPEEPLEMPIPKAAMDPMEMIGLDIGMFSGTKYLICMDRYSGYPLVGKLGKTSSTNEVIKLIQGWFRTFGYAKRARHDDGPEFRDRFVAWLKQVGCKSEVSSAYNPASNGLAEAGVKNVKALLKKCMDRKECFETALAEFRIAPREDGYSPAELFYRRQVRGLLPELPKKLNVEEAEKARDRVQEAYTAQRQTRSASKPLVLGQRVWLQEQDSKKWSIGGVVKSIRDSGRSYVVETDGGAAYLRNRRYIKASTATARRNVVGASTAVVDKGKKRGGVRFKLKVQFEDVDSQK